MVVMPWIFLKPHATRSSTLQGQMKIHVCIVQQSNQKGVNVRPKQHLMFNSHPSSYVLWVVQTYNK
jgi:hypothetical protein